MSKPAPRVAVIGLGAIGSMVAWRLAARGVHVTGYEQYGVAHDRGASAGQTRRFSVQTQKERRLTPVALDALELWRELEQASGRNLLHQTGGVIIGPRGTPALTTAALSAEENGLAHEVLDATALRTRWAQHLVRDDDQGVTDPMAGFVRPEASVATAVETARRSGAVVRPHTRVVSVETGPAGVRVVTTEDAATFDRVVLTTGPWARELLPSHASLVVPRRLVQGWYLARDPEEYWPEKFGVFERVGDVQAYGFPTLDGATIKIGIYTQGHPVVYDLDNVRRSTTPGLARRLAAIVEEFFPGLYPDPVSLQTGLEGYTTDGLPLVGALDDDQRLFAALGFSGAGFKFAPAFGDIVADLVTDQAPRRDVSFLAAGRDLDAWPNDLTTLE